MTEDDRSVGIGGEREGEREMQGLAERFEEEENQRERGSDLHAI